MIKRFVRDLNMNVEVNMVPIVRAEDGLALSSRNKYLSDKEKKAALVLSQSLKEAQKAFKSGKKSVTELKALITEKIQAEPLAQIDYIDIYTFPDLEECEMIVKEALVALAVKFGTTRLIDNTILGGE